MGIPKNAEEQGRGLDGDHLSLLDESGASTRSPPYQTDPTRNSVFFDPALNQEVPVPRRRPGRRIDKAQILDIASIPETFQLITIAAERVRRRAQRLGRAPAEACKTANDEWIKVLKGGGYLK